MPDPAVSFVLSVVCDEQMQAHRGEAAVVVGDAAVWSQRFSKRDMEGHVAGAIVALAQAAREALEIASATKGEAPADEEPPPAPPTRPPRRRREQAPAQKTKRDSGVSLSRRL